MAIFTDTFTAGTNQALSAHVPDFGTSWELLWTSTDEATTGWIVNSSLDEAGQLTSNNTGSIYVCNGTYLSADYYIQADLSSHGIAAGATIYLFVRVQDQENMYAVKLTDNNSGTTTCSLYKKVSGTWSAVGSAFNPPAVDSIIKLEIIGSSLKFYDDGVEIASATDTDITLTGRAGIGGAGGAELVTAGDDSSSANRLDDISVVDLSVGAGVGGFVFSSNIFDSSVFSKG